jgi:hypothetical protein
MKRSGAIAAAPAIAGAAGAAGVPLNPFIAKKLADGSHLDLLIHQQQDIVQTVDFSTNTVRQVYSSNLYSIYFTSSPDKLRPVTVLFPNHKVENKQVLQSQNYTFLASFNKDLNDALEASLVSTDALGSIQLAVCYGKHIYICKAISGTVYVLWASDITRTNGANVANTLYQKVPVLVNMDGQARVKAVFILKPVVSDESDLDRLPVTQTNPKLLFNKDKPLFVCEVKPQILPSIDDNGSIIQTVSRREALAIVTAPTNTSPAMYRRERNPFAASIDMEEVVAANSDPDGGTPRPNQLYMRDVNIGRCNTTTPPILQSDGEPLDDPFMENEKRENIV